LALRAFADKYIVIGLSPGLSAVPDSDEMSASASRPSQRPKAQRRLFRKGAEDESD